MPIKDRRNFLKILGSVPFIGILAEKHMDSPNVVKIRRSTIEEPMLENKTAAHLSGTFGTIQAQCTGIFKDL